MSKCPDCHTDMKPLFSVGEFCPNECDLPPEKRTVKPTTNLVTTTELIELCVQCGRKGIPVVITTNPAGFKETVYVCGGNHSWFSTVATTTPAGYPSVYGNPSISSGFNWPHTSGYPYTAPLYPTLAP